MIIASLLFFRDVYCVTLISEEMRKHRILQYKRSISGSIKGQFTCKNAHNEWGKYIIASISFEQVNINMME